ncbi:MAG: hypothetical protein U5K54_21950 [Cytophagales bacterium]|nr:hypothetical protein [Cytophagales bacterium]
MTLVYRIAAGFVFVMISVGIGYWVIKNQERERELAELKKQVEDTRSMMVAMIEDQQSASREYDRRIGCLRELTAR